jgi:hypothetical protein
MILYILLFEKGTHFKIGYSKVQEQRLSILENVYKNDFGAIDYAKSFQVEGLPKQILKLEDQLKNDYSKFFHHHIARDGYTETIAIEYFNDVLVDVKSKVSKERLGLTLQELQRPPKKEFKRNVCKCTKSIVKERPYEYELNVLDFFKHPYGQQIMELVQLGNNTITLLESEMPGIFVFAYHMLNQYPRLTKAQKREEFKSGKLIRKTYFNKVDYVFLKPDHAPERVVLHSTNSLLEDVLSGELKDMIEEYDSIELLELHKLSIDHLTYDFDVPFFSDDFVYPFT